MELRELRQQLKDNNFIIKVSDSPNERDNARAINKLIRKKLKEYWANKNES